MSSIYHQKTSRHGSTVVKEEPEPDLSALNVMENSQDAMQRRKVSYSDNIFYDTENLNQDDRASSPLDTIAEVACRIGTALPTKRQSISNDVPLPGNAFTDVPLPGFQKRDTDSPTSIPTQEEKMPFPPTPNNQRDQVSHEALICLNSLLRILRSPNLEGISNLLRLGNKLSKTDGPDGTEIRNMDEQGPQDMRAFNEIVMTKLTNLEQEINVVKAKVVSLQNTIEHIQCEGQNGPLPDRKEIESGGSVRREHVLTIKPEDVGKVCFIIKRMDNCDGDKDIKKDEDTRIDGNELTIHVERKCLGKREVGSIDWAGSGSEADEHGGKKMKQMEIRRDVKQRLVRGESIAGTDSLCKSEKSDWDYTENGNKRSKIDGPSAKAKGKVVRRRRDNWTEEENKVFMGIVLGNQELEEMSLRRMLARRFSPRRTHEQCANHLRILRSQKKLPPAKEEGYPLVANKEK